MTDIVEQLRDIVSKGSPFGSVMSDAADMIDSLRRIVFFKKGADHTFSPAQPTPERGSPEWFCQWLSGYLNCITGRDELDAFEANSIRSELARVFPSPAAVPSETDADLPTAQDVRGILPRSSAGKGGALHDIRVLLQAIYDLIDDEEAAEPLDYAIAHAKKALAILDTINEPQPAPTREQIAALARRFWSIHPSELDDLGLTREEFYASEITKLFASSALSRPQSRGVEASEGFVSVELLQIERDTADRLREENARLRALIPPQKERNRFCANADCHYPDCLVGGACPSQPQEGGK